MKIAIEKNWFNTEIIKAAVAGLGPRSKTSLFYEAFSLSSGLDFSSSESSRGQAGDSSGSSSSSLSPTSGYSSYDILDTLGANRDIGNEQLDINTQLEQV